MRAMSSVMGSLAGSPYTVADDENTRFLQLESGKRGAVATQRGEAVSNTRAGTAPCVMHG